MAIKVVEESVSALPDYGRISIAFRVESRLRIEPIDRGIGGLRLVEEAVPSPYIKDYDADSGEGPAHWSSRWDISNWGILGAFREAERVGGAAVAWRTPGLDMLGGRDDVAVLWDIRVASSYRQQGVGAQLYAVAVSWARERKCRLLKAESQNVNVAACRFYAANGCELRTILTDAYPDHPDEIQLIWYLDL